MTIFFVGNFIARNFNDFLNMSFYLKLKDFFITMLESMPMLPLDISPAEPRVKDTWKFHETLCFSLSLKKVFTQT